MSHHEVCVVIQGYAATALPASHLDVDEATNDGSAAAINEDFGTRLLLNAWAPKQGGRQLFPADANTIRAVVPARLVFKSAVDASRMVLNRLTSWCRSRNAATATPAPNNGAAAVPKHFHLFVECAGESLELMASVLEALEQHAKLDPTAPTKNAVYATVTVCTRCELCADGDGNNPSQHPNSVGIDERSALSLARCLASRGCPATVVSVRSCDDPSSPPPPHLGHDKCCDRDAVQHLVVAPRQPLDVSAWLAHHRHGASMRVPPETVMGDIAAAVRAIQTETAQAMRGAPSLAVVELTCPKPMRMFAVSTWLNRLPLGQAGQSRSDPISASAHFSILRVKGVLWAPNCRARVFLLDACGGNGQPPLKPHSVPVLHPGNDADVRVSRVVLVVHPTDSNTTDQTTEMLHDFKRALQREFASCAVNGSSTPLRFRVGDIVEAHVDGWSVAVVLHVWDEGNAYRLRVVRTGDEIWAPADDDTFVRNRRLVDLPGASCTAPPQPSIPRMLSAPPANDGCTSTNGTLWAAARHGARDEVAWVVDPHPEASSSSESTAEWATLAATAAQGEAGGAITRLNELLRAMPLVQLRQLVGHVTTQKKSLPSTLRKQGATCASTEACVALIASRATQCGTDYFREMLPPAVVASLMPLLMAIVGASSDEAPHGLIPQAVVQLFVGGSGGDASTEQGRATRSALGELCVELEIPLHALLRPHNHQIPSTCVAKAVLRLVTDGIVLRGARQAFQSVPIALLRSVASRIPAAVQQLASNGQEGSVHPQHTCASSTAVAPAAACATCAEEIWRDLSDCLVPLSGLQHRAWRCAACLFRVAPCPVLFTMHPTSATVTTTTTTTGCVRIDVRNASLMWYDRRGLFYAPPFEFSGCRWQLLLCNEDRPREGTGAQPHGAGCEDELAAYLCADRDVRCTFRIDLLHQCRDENVRVRSHHRYSDSTRFTKGWGSGVAPFANVLSPSRGFVSVGSAEVPDVVSFEVLISMGDSDPQQDGERAERAKTCTTEAHNNRLLQAMDEEDRDARRLAMLAKLIRSEESGRKDLRHQQRSVFEALLRAVANTPPQIDPAQAASARASTPSVQDANAVSRTAVDPAETVAARLQIYTEMQRLTEELQQLEHELVEVDAELDAMRSVKKDIAKHLRHVNASLQRHSTQVAQQHDAIRELSSVLQTMSGYDSNTPRIDGESDNDGDDGVSTVQPQAEEGQQQRQQSWWLPPHDPTADKQSTAASDDDTLQVLDQWLSTALGPASPSITSRCRQGYPYMQQV